MNIPVNRPDLSGNERRYLAECIDTGWISSEGPFVRGFEAAMAARTRRKHAVAVSNGSLALDLALAALGLASGDEVILPSFTIISCASAILRSGAVPVLVDSDPYTWNMDVGAIEARIGPRTRAIMIVHIYGLPVDMGPVLELAARHNLKIIEDAAEMHGQTWNGRPCGSFGDVSTFSFYPNKHVTSGEGGMVLTDEDSLAERLVSMRNLCFRPGQRFIHDELGWNYRLSNLQAAVGLAQVERLDEFVARKRRMGARYEALLEGVDHIRLPMAQADYARNIYWVFGLVLNDHVPFDAKEMMRRLDERGIGTRPFFWPMHEQPALRKLGLFDNESYPVAENLARRGFYIPSGVGISDDEIEQSASAVRSILKEL